jgi:hypothetical protein
LKETHWEDSPTRLQRALALRDTLLPWLRENGRHTEVSGHPTLKAEAGQFLIMHRTAFSGLHDHLPPAKQKDELKRYLTALYRQRDPRLRYGLDVWLYRRKVLDLAWDGDIVDLLSFAAGDWDTVLLRHVED